MKLREKDSAVAREQMRKSVEMNAVLVGYYVSWSILLIFKAIEVFCLLSFISYKLDNVLRSFLFDFRFVCLLIRCVCAHVYMYGILESHLKQSARTKTSSILVMFKQILKINILSFYCLPCGSSDFSFIIIVIIIIIFIITNKIFVTTLVSHSNTHTSANASIV